jgi:hypothetical protein
VKDEIGAPAEQLFPIRERRAIGEHDEDERISFALICCRFESRPITSGRTSITHHLGLEPFNRFRDIHGVFSVTGDLDALYRRIMLARWRTRRHLSDTTFMHPGIPGLLSTDNRDAPISLTI